MRVRASSSIFQRVFIFRHHRHFLYKNPAFYQAFLIIIGSDRIGRGKGEQLFASLHIYILGYFGGGKKGKGKRREFCFFCSKIPKAGVFDDSLFVDVWRGRVELFPSWEKRGG